MEHFIETVRKYPCLWKTSAIEYRDQELKDAAWAEIMKETDLSSVKEVKLKWKKLRDSYRDALKRYSDMLSRDPNNQCRRNYPWKYMGIMQFLQPYMSNRKKPNEAGSSPAAPRNGHAPDNGAGAGSDSSESESEAEASQPPTKRRGIDLKLQGKRRHTEATPRDQNCVTAPAQPLDPLDIFFNSMCQSTKRFPFQTQIKIKKCLFEAVMEAEEALLAEQQSYASLWMSGPATSSASSEPDVKPY